MRDWADDSPSEELKPGRSAERCLKPAQIAAGYVLLCVAYAKSDCRFEVGTESQAALYTNPFKG